MPKPGLRIKSVVKPVVVLKKSDLFSRNENVDKIADVAEQTATAVGVGEGEWTSHTTTSSVQWCKECQSLISTLQSLDDHVVEFHGGSKKINKANKQGMNNSSIVLGPKSKTIGSGSKGTSLSMQDTQKLDKSLPLKRIESRKVSKKSTTARKIVTENRKLQSQDSSSPIQSYFCQICELRFDTIVARNSHEEIHNTDTEGVEKPGIPEKTEVVKVDTNDEEDPDDVEIHNKKLFCYDCYTLVAKRNYVKHLMDHDEEKRVTQEHWLNGTTPSRKRKAPEPTTLLEEKEDRKYLYLNPNDPRRNSPNAILQCPVCPMQLFFSTATYQKHCDACQPLIKSRKQVSVVRGK